MTDEPMLNDEATDAYLRATHEELCSAVVNAETADEERDLLEQLGVIEYALFHGGFKYRPPSGERLRSRRREESPK